MSDAVPLLMPQLNPNDDHAVIVAWHVPSGSWVETDQLLLTVETSKANCDVNAPQPGYVFFDRPANAMVPVGEVIAWISEHPEPPAMTRPGGVAVETAEEVADRRFTRKALRLMKEHGLRPADFPGGGRVEVADVEHLVRQRARPAFAEVTNAEQVAQSPAKMLEVARLSDVYRQAIPSLVSVALSSERLNRRLQRLAAEFGPLTLLEIVIHDVAHLLGDFPELNGFHADGHAWRYRAVAVGFAVNLGRGLRVPVVREAATRSPLEIARRVRDLSLRYMRNELALEDVTGGTFTVTDLSGHGVVHVVPVLHDRQSAILGLCAERPGTGHRELVLTFDHRLADGMQAAAFLNELRGRLEAAPGD